MRETFNRALVATLGALHGGAAPADLPGIVLLGDIFDLSLGTPRAAIDGFGAFLKSLMRHGGGEWIGQFLFLPGNHDHELWTVTRFNQMLSAPREPGAYIHTTPAFADPAGFPPAALVDDLLRAAGFADPGGGPRAVTCYPNFGLTSRDGRRCVMLHHGHFIEPMYRAMSTLTALLAGSPDDRFDAEDLERLNGSWIDFIWSSAGDDGRLGDEVRRAHDALLTGGKDIRFNHRLADVIAARLAESLPVPNTATARGWLDVASRATVDALLGSCSQMERFGYQQALGTEGLAGLRAYLSGTVLAQIAEERPGSQVEDLTFIFGHTHKPFESRVIAPGLTVPPAVYNTGGWDMDAPMFGTRLGAAAVFIDDDLNVASLRLCDVPRDDGRNTPSKVRVATADGILAGNPLAKALDEAVTATGEDWTAFSSAAVAAYCDKRRFVMGQDLGTPRRDATAGAIS